MQASILGAWRLLTYRFETVETGETVEPFGADPQGTLILHPDGHMAVIITRRDRVSPATPAEQAEAFRNLVAYSGRFRLEPPNRLITSVDVAWFAGWVGGEQERTYALNGEQPRFFHPAAKDAARRRGRSHRQRRALMDPHRARLTDVPARRLTPPPLAPARASAAREAARVSPAC